MANVVSSFAQGFGLGNQVFDRYNQQQDRKEAKERRSVLEERNDTLWEQNQQDRELGLQDAEAVRERRKVLQQREDLAWGQQQKEYNHQVTLRNREEGYKSIFLPALDKAIVTGDFSAMETPEFLNYVKQNPQFDLNNLLGDDTGQALNESVQILRGAANGKLPEANDPKLINAVERLFPEITQSSALPAVYTDEKGNNHNIVSRSISRVIPTEDGAGFVLEQSLKLDNGKVVQTPITQNRSSNPNDNVMVVPMSAFTERMNTAAQARTQLTKTQLNNWRYLQSGRALSMGTSGQLGIPTKKKSGSKTPGGDKFTKDYMSDQQEIEKQINEEIELLNTNPSLDESQKQQRKAQILKAGEQRLAKNREMWSKYTDVHDVNLESKQRSFSAQRFVNETLNSYDGYNFDENDKLLLKQAVLDGKTPQQINEWIKSQINSGNISKRKGDENSRVDSILASWGEKGKSTDEKAEPNPPGDQVSENESLDELVLNPDISIKDKLAAISQSGLPEEEKRRLRERASYAGAYRAGNAISKELSKPLPLKSFKHQGFTYGNYGLSDKG